MTKARQVIVPAIKTVDGVLINPPRKAVCAGVALNGNRCNARWWTDAKQSAYPAIQDKVIAAITERLIENNIRFSAPRDDKIFE